MKKLLLMNLLLLYKISSAQDFGLGPDPQFSQFFGNPLYHNPAFTGESGTTRLMTTYRSQWNGLGDGGYKTYMAGVDSYVGKGVGLGFLAFRDDQFKNFNSNSFSFLGSYNVVVNDNNVIQWGLQGSWTFHQINDMSNLRFVDRFVASPNGVTLNPSTDPIAINRGSFNWSYPNFDTGVLWKSSIHSDDSQLFWAGATWHNMKFKEKEFQPKGRFGLQAGFRIPHGLDFIGNGMVKDMNRERSIAFTSYFRKQGQFSQLDLGINFQYEPMNFGLWYRNIPFKNTGYAGRDALTFIAGVKLDKFLIEYSYDLTVSSLNKASGGANEITIWYGLEYFLDVTFRGLDARRKLKCTNF